MPKGRPRKCPPLCQCPRCIVVTPDLPDEPCDELPGTAEKVERMRKRARARRQLFHPHDARWSGQVADKVGKLIIELSQNTQ